MVLALLHLNSWWEKSNGQWLPLCRNSNHVLLEKSCRISGLTSAASISTGVILKSFLLLLLPDSLYATPGSTHQSKSLLLNKLWTHSLNRYSCLVLTWLPGMLMWAIRSLMALRRSCRRRWGALWTSWSISSDSSRELRAWSHCHSSLEYHRNNSFIVLLV